MLPVGTTTTGFGLFSARVEPYQSPKNTRTIKPMMVTVWTYSFFQAFLSFSVMVCLLLGCGVLLCLRVMCFKTYRLEKEKVRDWTEFELFGSLSYRNDACLDFLFA